MIVLRGVIVFAVGFDLNLREGTSVLFHAVPGRQKEFRQVANIIL